jgi:hypothetical protein
MLVGLALVVTVEGASAADAQCLADGGAPPPRTGPVAPTNGCYVSMPTCPLFPQYTGTFRDTDQTANASPARCMQRAPEYFAWCATTLFATASFFSQGALQQRSTFSPGRPADASFPPSEVFRQPTAIDDLAPFVVGGSGIGPDGGLQFHTINGGETSARLGAMELSLPDYPNSNPWLYPLPPQLPQPPSAPFLVRSPGPSQLTPYATAFRCLGTSAFSKSRCRRVGPGPRESSRAAVKSV